MEEHSNGWCCVDCLMLLANGETPTEMSETETAEYLARVAQHTGERDVTLGRMLGEDGCECEDWDCDTHHEGCEQNTFSSSPCDVCGSHLGGSRDAVTFWKG
jgi:hypothetical protein